MMETTRSALVRMEGAALGYGQTPVLQNVTCTIQRGDAVGLVGPNGSGKTTFLRSVLQLIRPLGGRVEVDRAGRFAYVPQSEEVNLFLPLTLGEVVFLAVKARRPWGRVTDEEKKRVSEAMEQVGVAPVADILYRDASGGQRQKAILAQALSQSPDVILFDEPTRGLDVVAEHDFLAIVESLKSRNLTLFIVSHTLHIPLNHTEKILLFNAGRVIETTSLELIRSKKLEEIYGVPFLHHEKDGLRWVTPARGHS